MDASNFIAHINKRSRSMSLDCDQSSIWFEKYEPISEAEIGVVSSKIKQVKKAIEESAVRKGMIKLLILTGPTGCGKSALIKVLSRKYEFEITEWITPDRSWSINFGHMESFRQFMDKATGFNTLESVDRPNKGKIILMDDIPDLTTYEVKRQFFSIIQNCLNSSKKFLIVMIASDSYTTAENSNYSKLQNYARVIAPDLLKIDPRVEFIEFKPIGKSTMLKILKSIVQNEKIRITENKLAEVVEASNGDIRSAINALQFMSCAPTFATRKKRNNNGIVDFDSHIGNLSLFHAVGKVVYAKRNQDGTFESKPDHIINKLPVDNDHFIDYIHQNSLGFFHNIEDISNAFDDLGFADSLRSDLDWMEKGSSYYRSYISINGIMKNRRGTVSGTFKELAGTMFGKLIYEKRKESYKEYEKTWMESVALRKSYVVEEESEEEEEELMIEKMFFKTKRPTKKKSVKVPSVHNIPVDQSNADDDDAMYDSMFGDGSEFAELDF